MALPRTMKGHNLNSSTLARSHVPSATGNTEPQQRPPAGKTYSVIRLGGGRHLEIRRGWVDHIEQVGFVDYQNDEFRTGILIPGHALLPLAEAVANIVEFVSLDPTPTAGQERLF